MTSQIFPLPLNGQFSDDGKSFTLDLPFIYDDKEKELIIIVPAGFTSDFNSVPRLLQGYFPTTQYPEAGVVHDWLYRHPNGFYKKGEKWPSYIELNRGECDDIHRRILDLKGCRWTKRQMSWSALRTGGWVPWNRYRRGDR